MKRKGMVITMKYSENNKPIVCMMTQSICYRQTKKMKIKGVLWHSTGANNPTLKRYVQPDDNAKDKDALIANGITECELHMMQDLLEIED